MNTLRRSWMDLAVVLFAAWAVLIVPQAQAQSAADVEPKLKAAFLLNFARFATWPSSRFSTPGSAVVLCVFDDPGFAQVLEDSVAGKTVGSRPVLVSTKRGTSDMSQCHLAYFGRVRGEVFGDATAQVLGKAVLTVYDAEATLPDGLIRFYLEERRMRFEINTAAAAREDLQFSSKLLSLARVVNQ